MLTKIVNRAVEINKLHSQFCEGLRTTLQFAIKAGELLVAQKKECGHGAWMPWVETNLKFSHRTVNNYIRCYYRRRMLNSQGTANLTIEDVARASTKPSKEELAERSLSKEEKQVELYRKIKEMMEDRIRKLWLGESRNGNTVIMENDEEEPSFDVESEPEEKLVDEGNGEPIEEIKEKIDKLISEHKVKETIQGKKISPADKAKGYYKVMVGSNSPKDVVKIAEELIKLLKDKYPQLKG